MEKPLRVFCCYSRKDQQYMYELKSHLMGLQREKLIKYKLMLISAQEKSGNGKSTSI